MSVPQRPSDLVQDDLPEVDLSDGVGQRAAVTPPAAATARPSIEDVTEALKDVVDPELGINVVDLGLIYGVAVNDDSTVTIDMTLTSAACPLTDAIEDQTADALEGLVADFSINWVWLPQWTLEMITDDGRDQLRALGYRV